MNNAEDEIRKAFEDNYIEPNATNARHFDGSYEDKQHQQAWELWLIAVKWGLTWSTRT